MDLLAGEDVLLQRRFRRYAGAVIAVLAILLAIALMLGLRSIRDTEEARRQRDVATVWAERRLFTTSMMLTDRVEGAASLWSVLPDGGTGAGLTYGVRAWNQRSGSLHSLLVQLDKADHALFVRVFGDGDEALAADLIVYTGTSAGGLGEGNADPKFDLSSPAWVERFEQASSEPVFQAVQLDLAFQVFRASWSRLRTLAPEIRTERGVAFVLDVAMQHGWSRARAIIEATRGNDVTEAARMERMEQESVRGLRAPARRYERPIAERRRLFRTTPLLLDEPVSGALVDAPSLWTDVSAWFGRLLERDDDVGNAADDAPVHTPG